MAKWIREKRSRRCRFDGATPTAAAEQGLRSLAGSPVESIESASDRRESGVSQRERYAPDSVLGFRFPGSRGLVLSSATSSSTSRQPRGQARHAVPPLHGCASELLGGHVGDPDEQVMHHPGRFCINDEPVRLNLKALARLGCWLDAQFLLGATVPAGKSGLELSNADAVGSDQLFG